MSRNAELLNLAGICRKQAAMTVTATAKAALVELAEQYEAEARTIGHRLANSA